ncbi:MAG: hypothetical protein ACREBC_36590, partial [Pyrinomonadaceae bacterium]
MPQKTQQRSPEGMGRREFLSLVSAGTLVGGNLLDGRNALGDTPAPSPSAVSSSTHGMKYRRLGRTDNKRYLRFSAYGSVPTDLLP